MSKYCIYLYADILGYRELLKDNGVQKINLILEDYLNMMDDIVMSEQKRIKYNQKSNKSVPKKYRHMRFFQDFAEGFFEHFFAFDTIFLCFKDISKGTVDRRLRDFFLLSSTLYIFLLAKHFIKIRGVIKITEDYVVNKKLIIINEIEDCFQLEKAQNWSGILVDIPNIQGKWWGLGAASEDECFYYEVPFKKQLPSERVVLNPINKHTVNYANNNSLSLLKSLKLLEEEALQVKITEEVRQKLINTALFIKECIRRYNYSLEIEEIFEDSFNPPHIR